MDKIAGAWQLVDYHFDTAEGRRFFPWGERPVGWFFLDEAGNMSAQIMHEKRPDMDHPPSEDQAARSYHSYVAYFGRTTVDLEGMTITTRVTGALNPDWVGRDQVRSFSFEGERLTLKTPPLAMGNTEITGTIIWEKLEG